MSNVHLDGWRQACTNVFINGIEEAGIILYSYILAIA
jgi:hypothetical protein